MSKKQLVPKYRFNIYKNSPSWKIKTLGSLSIQINKHTNNKKYILLSSTAGVGLVPQVEKFGKEIAGNSYKNYIVIEKNDFAYNKSATKQYPEGYIAMLKDYSSAAIPGSIFTCFRIIDRECLPDFFDYLFSINYHGKWLKKYISVGARAHGALNINTEHLWEIPFVIPNYKEQEKIVQCLKSVDELILLEEDKLEKLKSHKKGLLQKLFPKDNKSMPELRFPQYKEQWLLEKLIKKVIYKNGKAHEDSIVINGRYIVVNSKFISTNGLIKKYSNSPNLLAKKGDILVVLSDVPNGKALGKCFMVDKDETYTVNQRVCCLTPVNIDKKYLFFILNRNNYFLSFDDGIGQTNLKKEDVLAFSFYAPQNSKEQQKIANCISSIDDLISAQTRKIELLKQHKKGLLQGLFPSIKEVEND